MVDVDLKVLLLPPKLLLDVIEPFPLLLLYGELGGLHIEEFVPNCSLFVEDDDGRFVATVT